MDERCTTVVFLTGLIVIFKILKSIFYSIARNYQRISINNHQQIERRQQQYGSTEVVIALLHLREQFERRNKSFFSFFFERLEYNLRTIQKSFDLEILDGSMKNENYFTRKGNYI